MIMSLLKTDKWANFYVEVWGNYEFGSSTKRGFPKPKVKATLGSAIFTCIFSFIASFVLFLNHSFCFADLGPISQTQKKLAEEEYVKLLRSITCRHAPILLEYTPSYEGIMKEEKAEEEEEQEQEQGGRDFCRAKSSDAYKEDDGDDKPIPGIDIPL